MICIFNLSRYKFNFKYVLLRIKYKNKLHIYMYNNIPYKGANSVENILF